MIFSFCPESLLHWKNFALFSYCVPIQMLLSYVKHELNDFPFGKWKTPFPGVFINVELMKMKQNRTENFLCVRALTESGWRRVSLWSPLRLWNAECGGHSWYGGPTGRVLDASGLAVPALSLGCVLWTWGFLCPLVSLGHNIVTGTSHYFREAPGVTLMVRSCQRWSAMRGSTMGGHRVGGGDCLCGRIFVPF